MLPASPARGFYSIQRRLVGSITIGIRHEEGFQRPFPRLASPPFEPHDPPLWAHLKYAVLPSFWEWRQRVPVVESSSQNSSDSRSCRDCSSDPCGSPPASAYQLRLHPHWL